MLLLLIALTTDVGEAAIERFALREAPRHVSEYLKAPATAKYGVKDVTRAAPSSTLAPGRYIVTGSVDSQNGFGALVRNEWKASVAVAPDGAMDLLFVAMTGGNDGKEKILYKGPAAKRYRKEVYEGVLADFRAFSQKMTASWKKVPVKKRDAIKRRDVAKFVAETRKKYQLEPGQMEEILGIED